ncbi:AAA domain-containing protein [Inediibacterium massiliense]|uniref:AAA domain-containing protein n=1 Tax=Inediibacterium massiliense TaxID=1658111 RepID=UPI0006B699E1|nr:AAA domain-containing protein [Inediibacterium massiliense]
MEKKKVTKKIVNFWYIIEILTQEKFPKQDYISRKITDRVREYSINTKNTDPKGIKYNKFTIYTELKGQCEISDKVKKDDENYKFHQEVSSIGHICYGKVQREGIVRKLYEVLKVEDKRQEKEIDDICLFTFKSSFTGEYEEKSLQVSPLIWGVYKCYANKDKKHKGISHDDYQDEVELIEREFGDDLKVNNEFIDKIYKLLFDKYIVPLELESYTKKVGVFIYSRFKNEEIKEKEEEKLEDVSELVKSFYSDDLSMISSELSQLDSFNDMQNDVIEYIINRYYSDKKPKHIEENKINIRTDKHELESVLSIENISLGKWPSKFNPALMQQVAINYGMFENELQNIFSVNGPPGTGKTTLLKEIIAHNIVERAIKLSEYDNPDDAFFPISFYDDQGKKKVYHQFFPNYYVFKDESINHHSMLVASNNNAAVENITVELPNSNSLLKGLSPSLSDNTKDTMKLRQNHDLFDISKCKTKELYSEYRDNPEAEKDKNAKKKIEVKEFKEDIYFSWLAHKRLTNGENGTDPKEINTWGLISAPLGKKSNLNTYYYNVLSHFVKTAMKYTKTCSERLIQYEVSRKKFLSQLKLVEKLKKELILDLKAEKDFEIRKKKIEKKLRDLEDSENKLKKQINKVIDENNNLSRSKKIKEIEVSKIEEKRQDEYVEVELLEADVFQNEENLKNISDTIKKMEENIGLIDKLIYKFYKTEKMNEVDREKVKRTEIHNDLMKVRKKLKEHKGEIKKLLRQQRDLQKKIKKIDNSIDDNLNVLEEYRKKLNEIDSSKLELHQKIEQAMKVLNEKLDYIKATRAIIDNEFWENLNSKDEKASTKAQLTNPWITSDFNREREKLFYYALQLHKNFILSSKSCRCNFNLLGMLWGYVGDENNEIKVFYPEHKDQAFPHLLNTLFLLTPVFSTTFASVGRFLKNVKQGNSIGLLIVDEAGQATPQIALGALWRSRKAIIVGDPKQVEPVVTSDTEIIMKAFSDDILSSYQNKTLSVQGFADAINPIGSFIKDQSLIESKGDWVGCPLVVHRRCINPMFDISNELSYGKTMKYQTNQPDESSCNKFLILNSCWIDIKGTEVGHKNHYVREQGKAILELVKKSFNTYSSTAGDSSKPSLYIISPFTTVINALRDLLSKDKSLSKFDYFEDWLDESLGTVHKFQGKEANEVIFALGCDKNAMGAVKWVNRNILNVAATRAKYRFYIIGDYEIWTKSEIFEIASRHLPKLENY